MRSAHQQNRAGTHINTPTAERHQATAHHSDRRPDFDCTAKEHTQNCNETTQARISTVQQRRTDRTSVMYTHTMDWSCTDRVERFARRSTRLDRSTRAKQLRSFRASPCDCMQQIKTTRLCSVQVRARPVDIPVYVAISMHVYLAGLHVAKLARDVEIAV